MKMSQPTAASEILLYPQSGLTDPNLSTKSPLRRSMKSPLRGSTVDEQYINDKILADNKFKNNINIIIDIRTYYETDIINYNKKLSRYKNYINVAEITEILLSSIATTARSTSVALTGITLPYSIPTAFATATVCSSLSKTVNTKIRNKIVK